MLDGTIVLYLLTDFNFWHLPNRHVERVGAFGSQTIELTMEIIFLSDIKYSLD